VLLAAALVLGRLPAAPAAAPPAAAGLRALLHVPRRLALLGALTALAFFIENAWQSWSAVHLEIDLDAAPSVAALGPALFAASAVAGRLAGHRLASRVGGTALVAGGALLAAVGTLGAAIAPTTAPAVAGIAVAGLGTSVCAPTLISLAGRGAGPGERAAAVSIVTTIAYVGFLVGPAAVGLVADALGLRAALGAISGLAVVLALAARAAPAAAGRPAGGPPTTSAATPS
jgi:MFS family permease